MHEHDEVETPLFACHRLNGERAAVELTYRVGTLSQEAGARVRVLSACGCDDSRRCGVGSSHGLSTTFDWNRCVHPKAPRQ